MHVLSAHTRRVGTGAKAVSPNETHNNQGHGHSEWCGDVTLIVQLATPLNTQHIGDVATRCRQMHKVSTHISLHSMMLPCQRAELQSKWYC
jgi:hypothetical protein